MCGLFGSIGYAVNCADDHYLNLVSKRLSLRGPDYSNIIKGQAGSLSKDRVCYAIGHTRLSIVDLSMNSSQPFVSEDKSVLVTFNGEIFNYKNLRSELQSLNYKFKTSGESEVICIGYKHWGIDVISKVSGIFSVVIFDISKGFTLLARDKIGTKPLYYNFSEGRLSYASESNLVNLLKRNRSIEINPNGLSSYLLNKYIPVTESMIDGVFSVKPGTCVVISKSGVLSEIKITEEESRGYQIESGKYFYDIFGSVIERQVPKEVQFGCFLSGGVDSSLICSYAREYSNMVSAYTIGFDVNNFSEINEAREIASHLGIELKFERLTGKGALDILDSFYDYYDEPFADTSALPSIALSNLASKDVKVCLAGDGADEAFLGYKWYKLANRLRNWYNLKTFNRKAIVFLTKKIGINLPGIYLHSSFKEAYLSRVAINNKDLVFLANLPVNSAQRDSLINVENFEIKSKKQLADFLIQDGLTTWLEGNYLKKVDRASMSSGLEVRVPFLDDSVLHFALSKDYGKEDFLRLPKIDIKQALAKSLPWNIINRPKKGFTPPIDNWMQGVMRDLIFDTFSSIGRYEILNQPKAQNLLSEYYDKKNTRNLSQTIWTILMFQLWCEKNL